MPLMTEIRKGNGHRLKLHWGWWHVEMMLHAAGAKSIFDPVWPYTMPHDFAVCDVRDHEELVIRKGWILDMWRN